MPHSDDDLIERARAGDEAAKRSLVERATLRGARALLDTGGTGAKARYDMLRDVANAEGPAPTLGILLAAIGFDGTGEIRRALELVYRARTDRWGPPERDVVGQFVLRRGAELGAELALELLEWAAPYPGDLDPFVRGAAIALADVRSDAFESLAWRTGFQEFVVRDRTLVMRWSAGLEAVTVARALFSHHARERTSCVPALDAIWTATTRRDHWAAALANATGQNGGMSGREEIVTWGWRRFCEGDLDEQRDLYAAFEPWRSHWIELRNATPIQDRPGGASAVAHLRLWGGLDVRQLPATVDEAARLASDADWSQLVDTTFDLAEAAPRELRLHALAGACRIAHEVTTRIRNRDVVSPGITAAADRLIARAEVVNRQLRESGAVLDQIVANRVEDLETDLRLIREAREREREGRERDEERRVRLATAEAERLRAEEARAHAEEVRRRADAEMRLHVTVTPGPGSPPRSGGLSPSIARGLAPDTARGLAPDIPVTPIDGEIFFASLPVPTVLAYARMFKRLSTEPDAVQKLAADGITMDLIAVINQAWAGLFAKRTDLAIRFSLLISATWS